MIIFGIDPGLADIGWSVVEFNSGRFQPISYGAFKTPAGEDLQKRILMINTKIASLVKQYKVDCAAIEEIFFTPHTTVSCLNVSKVIGSLLNTLGSMGIPVRLFTPLQIKQSITGYGAAEKEQVQNMVKVLLKLDEIPRPNHAADALSAAICLGHTLSTQARMKK